MKKFSCLSRKIALSLALTGICFLSSPLSADVGGKAPVVRIVNFKTCVEQSKMGKHEQATFEGLKKQMESVLEEKEKVLNDHASKVNDPDYLDSLSAEAETDLKRKFRAMSQEIAQLQNQYYQALSQTNMKVLQKLNEVVVEASKKIAKEKNIDLILNEESAFFYSSDLDISSEVVAFMDKNYSEQEKDKPAVEIKKG